MNRKDFIAQVTEIFEYTKDRYQCHNLLRPILEKASYDHELFIDIFKYNLSSEQFLRRNRHYSTLSMEIFENENFTMLINIFPPLPDKNTDITFQSIHHHGSLLLSTVGFMGEGYSSILYKKGFQIDNKSQIAMLEIEEYYENKNHEVKFVDAFQPHVVFYPKSFSATLVVWSENEKRVKDNLKKISVLSKFKKPIGKIIRRLGVENLFGINKIQNFDFYRKDGIYYSLRTRLAYDNSCSNLNFIQNILAFIQAYGFHDTPFLTLLKSNPALPKGADALIQNVIEGHIVADAFCEKHLNIPFVNLHKKDLMDQK